jgi:hypothetical protein
MATPAENLVCAIIRGDVTSWPLLDNGSLNKLVEAAFNHSVQLILFDTLKKLSTLDRWPPSLRERLKNDFAAACALELIGERELRKVLSCLEEHRIRLILLKGVPLAYTIYQSPTLRPRGDMDLLIRESDMQRVGRILSGLGYDGPELEGAKLVSYQCSYRRKDSYGICHHLDVHWKISNEQLFARTFSFDELLAEAIEIPSLARCALGLGHVHALLLACMHRFVHAHAPFYVNGNPVYAGDHLRWVYDIHLLCSALNTGQWSEFTTLARTKKIAGFCVDGLNAARQAFNTKIPGETISALQTATRNEAASTQRLRTSTPAWFLANLRALPDLRQRIALVKQVALPPSAYMMEKYQINNRLALPFLYGYRLVKGVFMWFK